MKRRTGRIVFALGFVVLLFDGAAAIWLGQVSGRRLLVVVGLALVAAALLLALIYRRWLAALEEIARARDALKAEVGALKEALDAARAGRKPPG
jgi:hypothetical protein